MKYTTPNPALFVIGKSFAQAIKDTRLEPKHQLAILSDELIPNPRQL
jgi:hypothetical protein